MKDTLWRDDYTRLVKRRALNHTERQGTFAIDMWLENVYGNGGLLTTVSDLLKWNQNFTNPVVGGPAFISELQRPGVFNDGRSHEYALGLYVDTYKGVREVDHSGGGPGSQSHLGRYPDQHVSVAVLCNVGSANATAAAKAVAELFLTGLGTAPPPAPSHTLTANEAAHLVGLYRMRQRVGVATVVYDQNGLRIQYQHGARLVPRSATQFVAHDGYMYEFDGHGQMRATDEFGSVTVYDRVEPAKPSVDQLKDFTGRYYSDEIETTLNVVMERERLLIRRWPDFTAALTPVYADAFSMGTVWVIFRRDASQRIIGFSISGERLWDLPFTRKPEPARTAR
jgi:hypothetical protein